MRVVVICLLKAMISVLRMLGICRKMLIRRDLTVIFLRRRTDGLTCQSMVCWTLILLVGLPTFGSKCLLDGSPDYGERELCSSECYVDACCALVDKDYDSTSPSCYV